MGGMEDSMKEPLYLTTLVTNMPSVLHLTQNESGRIVKIMLRDTAVPSDVIVGLWVEKPSGELYYMPGEASGQEISITIEKEAVSEFGTAKGQLWLKAAGESLKTFPFTVKIDKEV